MCVPKRSSDSLLSARRRDAPRPAQWFSVVGRLGLPHGRSAPRNTTRVEGSFSEKGAVGLRSTFEPTVISASVIMRAASCTVSGSTVARAWSLSRTRPGPFKTAVVSWMLVEARRGEARLASLIRVRGSTTVPTALTSRAPPRPARRW
jgi:hypothetical protein